MDVAQHPMGGFMNNPVVQELKKGHSYFANGSNECIYVDLRQAKAYTRELEKPKRIDSKMTITIENRQSLSKKMLGDTQTVNAFTC